VKQKADTVEKYSIEDIEPLISSIIGKYEGATEQWICTELGYNDGYISQMRSREKKFKEPQVPVKFYNQLNNFSLQNANSYYKPDSSTVAKEPTVKYEKTDVKAVTGSGEVFFVEAKDLTASYERMLEEKEKMIAEKEARRLEAKEWAERAEKEKDRLLTIIEKNLTVLLSVTGRIDANLTEAQSDLFEIENSQRVQHTVMMHSLERIEGEPGKLDKELDTLERASPPVEEQSGKSVD
jgi:hypothetical protein